MKILEIKNLNMGFDCEEGFCKALYDVSLSLNQGRMLSIVGESGCGKTITAMSIIRLLPKTARITSGEIFFEGKNLLELPSKDMQLIRGAKIALIPQDPMTSLNPLYTVGDQLLEVIEIHSKLQGKDAVSKAIEAFDMVQIPDAKNRLKAYPHEFSGGMKQRAIIAMALACDADILIADEPTTALDVTIQAQIMDLIKNLQKEKNLAVMLITHDLALVREYTDDVAVMYSGRIVEKAPSEEFFKNPSHPYSIALLNSIPSNKEQVLKTIEGQPPSIHQHISGCKFHPRCSSCMDICKIDPPPYFSIASEHNSACYLHKSCL